MLEIITVDWKKGTAIFFGMSPAVRALLAQRTADSRCPQFSGETMNENGHMHLHVAFDLAENRVLLQEVRVYTGHRWSILWNEEQSGSKKTRKGFHFHHLTEGDVLAFRLELSKRYLKKLNRTKIRRLMQDPQLLEPILTNDVLVEEEIEAVVHQNGLDENPDEDLNYANDQD